MEEKHPYEKKEQPNRRGFFNKFRKIAEVNRKTEPNDAVQLDVSNAVWRNNDENQNKLSRREMLKVATITAGAVATAPLIEPLNLGLQKLGILEKGNLPEVARKVIESMTRYCTSENEEEKAIEESFLKFNAAILYGKSIGMQLAPEMMKHFLYGYGEEKDISNELLSVLKKGYQEASENQQYPYSQDIPKDVSSISDEEVLSFHAHNVFEKHIGSFKGTFLKDETNQNRVHSSDIDSYVGREISMFGVIGTIIPDKDLQYSLGEYTIKLKGDLQTAYGNHVELSNPQLEIQDHYDWSKAWGLEVRANLGDYADQIGIGDTIPEDWLNKLRAIDVIINDADGALLQENGRGNNFDVIARYNLQEGIEIDVKNFSE